MIRENCPFCKNKLALSNGEAKSYYYCRDCKCETDSSMPRYVCIILGDDFQEEFGWKDLYIINDIKNNKTTVKFLVGYIVVKSFEFPLQQMDLDNLSNDNFERKMKLWLTFY